MKHLRIFLASTVIALAALPALAQESPSEPGPMHGYGHMYGYGHMWDGGWGWHPGIVLGPFVLLLALIGVVALILWLVRWQSHGGYHHWYGHGGCPQCGHGRGRAALDVLEERFARGEIDKTEFEEKRKLLGR